MKSNPPLSNHPASTENRRRSPETGFTLVELLVVIAIIATLAAFSLAIIPRMKASARQAACLSKVRNVGNLLVTSAVDSGGNIQIFKGGAGGTKTTEYIPYFIVARESGFPTDTKRKTLYEMMKDVMFCPSAPKPRSPYYKYTYGVNLNPSQEAGAEWIDREILDPDGSSYVLTVLNVSRVQSPNSYVLVADSCRANGQQSYTIYGSDLIALRHKKQANACFLDGSGRALTEGDLGRLGFRRAYDCSTKPPKSVNIRDVRNRN